jgi:hypothetical protein
MPFPLAHPAAVLPLRRYCPRHLSFLALVVGSLTPDLGYVFGRESMWRFSHRFVVGTLEFCLPAGLIIILALYALRAPLIKAAPARTRPLLLSLCRHPPASPFIAVLSLLIGTATHTILDSITHEDGWMVDRFAILRMLLPGLERYDLRVNDLLYIGCTFLGVTWLALAYLRWLNTITQPLNPLAPKWNWGCAVGLAGAILAIALASRGPDQRIGIVPAGIITLVLIMVFLVVTGRDVGLPQSNVSIGRYDRRGAF